MRSLPKSLRRSAFFLLFIGLLVAVGSVSAHANLLRSDPVASATLNTSPQAITLWFSEPLEPAFSSITLLDSRGSTINTPPSAVNPADDKQMLLLPGTLPDGVYTVSWRAISATDGHPTSGSFAFAVGAVTGLIALAAPDSETIPPLSAPIRWFDLVCLTLLVGGVAFAVCVACPAQQEQRMRRLMGFGWSLTGLSTLVVLLYQTAQATNGALTPSAISTILLSTRFGALLIARVIVWGLMGIALLRRRYGIGVAAGGVLLLLHAVYSHASISYDLLPALAVDWLHLAATVFWVGGLIQFLNLLLALPRDPQQVATLTARFSNYARVCVAVLIVSGLYSAWLEIGSLAALIDSLYGRALLVKSVLFVPLLLIAAVNLLLTQRGLNAGKVVWSRRLRGLVGAEIALTLGIFAAVGVMTSADPGRASLASRLPPPDNTLADYQVVGDIHIHLDVSPGWVGQNEFDVLLLDLDGNPVDNASLIRVRFDNQTQNVGQSEVRPQPVGDGEYKISGANLSVPGTWRARVTVQRPNQFDALADFTLKMDTPPIPPGLDLSQPFAGRTWALLIVGLALLAVGGFAGGRGQFTPFREIGLLATVTILVGLICLLGALAP